MTRRKEFETEPTIPHRIDVDHHILPPEYLKALATEGVNVSLGACFPQWSVERHLK